jgi:hypothetical protein
MKKCYWATTVILLSATLLYSVVMQMERYFRYEVQVVMDIEQEQNLVFPAVTVCNTSPVKKSALAGKTAAALGGQTKTRKKRYYGKYHTDHCNEP